ncbi:MAG: TetR family transcriptional regulator [Rhodospirillaceae bacterium]|nr:TetR family transcriptional regulator [Rhodospirillaceae bacterium]MCA8933553.1 TetR family transcriptional regulator [Rhodospirillaceae bacterium]
MARTRALDYDEKRQAILRRSVSVIAERGVERASMAQIALECGVSKALLYHYYTSKEELVYDILSSYLENLDAVIADADNPELPPVERLRHLVYTTLDHYRDSDDQHKVQISAMRALPADKVETLREIERSIVQRFATVIESVNPALADDRPRLMPVTMSLFGMMNWVYMWFRVEGPLSRNELADLMTQLIINGVQSLDERPHPVSRAQPSAGRGTVGHSPVQ